MAQGRPPLLTPERADKIVTAIRAGATVRSAAHHANISDSSFSSWLERGRRERQRQHTLDDTNTDDPLPDIAEREHRYLDLLARVEAARADAEVEAVGILRRAITGWDEVTTVRDQTLNRDGEIVTLTRTSTVRKFSWQAAAWWLERTRPSEFGRYVRTEVTGADGGPIELAAVDLRARAIQLVDDLTDKRAQRAQIAPPESNGSTAAG